MVYLGEGLVKKLYNVYLKNSNLASGHDMEWVLPIETKLGERLGDGSTRDGGKSMAEVSAKINIKTQAKKGLKRQQKY